MRTARDLCRDSHGSVLSQGVSERDIIADGQFPAHTGFDSEVTPQGVFLDSDGSQQIAGIFHRRLVPDVGQDVERPGPPRGRADHVGVVIECPDDLDSVHVPELGQERLGGDPDLADVVFREIEEVLVVSDAEQCAQW